MPTSKHAFVIYAGPKETRRVFHALTYARQAHARGDAIGVYFAAEGTYWPGALADEQHPMHRLHRDVQDTGKLEGACENCAAAFGHSGTAGASCGRVLGPVDSDGQIDILGLEDAGWRVWLF